MSGLWTMFFLSYTKLSLANLAFSFFVNRTLIIVFGKMTAAVVLNMTNEIFFLVVVGGGGNDK